MMIKYIGFITRKKNSRNPHHLLWSIRWWNRSLIMASWSMQDGKLAPSSAVNELIPWEIGTVRA